MKLEEYANINSGSSLGRIKIDEDGIDYKIYNQNAFDSDFQRVSHDNQEEVKEIKTSMIEKVMILNENDLVISSGSHECTMIGHESFGQILPYNFMRINIINHKLNPLYFEYWFNHSKEARNQIENIDDRNRRRRLSLQDVRQLDITIPSIEIQKTMGEIYQIKKELNVLYKERDELTYRLFDFSLESEGESDESI